MDKTTKIKEAFKTGLAFALVFGLAMQFGWMNPYWAGWAVAVISLPTAGESLRKGALRILGTIPGCIAAVVINALAPQDRWTFLLLTCGWVFLIAYLMVSSRKYSYVWVMAAYVCLIILQPNADSSANMFESAVFRTVETAMGVIVYTLIAVFIWPRTNLGAIKKSSADLAAVLNELYRGGRDRMLQPKATAVDLQGLQARVLQQVAQFGKALQAEGSESYEVSKDRPLWERFQSLGTAFSQTVARWQSGLAELERIELPAVLPELPAFLAELDARLAELAPVLAGEPLGHQPRTVRLAFESVALGRLTGFERAAVEVARNELEELEALTAALLDCALQLAGHSAPGPRSEPLPMSSRSGETTLLPVPDWEHLRCAAYVTATTVVGFLVWILFDPPGHSGWFQAGGSFALVVALYPHLRPSRMIAPVAVTSAICLVIYVLVMPQLSSFLGLGSLLFACMFLNCYFLSGGARFFTSMAMLNILQIQNQQVYSFYVMVNMFLFLVMCFVFIYVMSYLLGSPRPEKAMLRMLDRFFRSAEFLMSRKEPGPGRVSPLERWRIAFHQRQLRSLPARLAVWGKAIDSKLFPANSPDQIHALVNSVQTLVHRFDQFFDAGPPSPSEPLTHDLREDLHSWHAALETLFRNWARNPEAETVAMLRQRLDAGLSRLEARLEQAVNRGGANLRREESEHFFRLLGGYRGVSEAALAYAGAAQAINWSHWREERFS